MGSCGWGSGSEPDTGGPQCRAAFSSPFQTLTAGAPGAQEQPPLRPGLHSAPSLRLVAKRDCAGGPQGTARSGLRGGTSGSVGGRIRTEADRRGRELGRLRCAASWGLSDTGTMRLLVASGLESRSVDPGEQRAPRWEWRVWAQAALRAVVTLGATGGHPGRGLAGSRWPGTSVEF